MKLTRTSFALVTSVLTWSLVYPLVARADEPPSSSAASSSAAEHAKKAQLAYDVQDWAAAIAGYQAAYQLDARPEYLWGLAQSQRLAGDYAAAIRSYKAFKRHESVTATQATAAEMQITKCEAERERKEAEAARARPAAASPAPAPAPSGTPVATTTASSDRPSDKRGPFYTDVLGDVLFVSGVAAAGVGTFLLLRGNADMRSAPNASTYQAYDANVDGAKEKQIVGATVIGVGSALVVLAIVRWAVTSPSKAAATGALHPQREPNVLAFALGGGVF